MNGREAFALALVIGYLAANVGSQTQQSPPDPFLHRQIEVDGTADITTTEAFSTSLLAAQTPGGIVRITDCEAETVTQRLTAHSSTLQDLLKGIVLADPRYRWEARSGVVNLIPRDGEAPLLGTRIRNLDVTDAASIYLPLSKLMSLPEVREMTAKLQLSDGTRFSVMSASVKSKRYTVSCENVTLREALNAIVRAHGRAVWAYREKRCEGKLEFFIDFIIE